MPVWLLITALFVLGFLLIFIEVVIIPGFGLTGILGTISLGAACYLAFTSLNPLIGVLITVCSIGTVILLFKILPKTSVWKKIRLSITESKQTGFRTGKTNLNSLINKTGLSLTMLRPSGTAIINKKRYDVITDGEFIEPDTKIIVDSIKENRIIVKKLKDK